MSASGYPGFDGLVDAFKNADQEALYAFSAVLQGWLSQEHKADGTHSAITADSAIIGALSITTIDRVRMKSTDGAFLLLDAATIGVGGGETKTDYTFNPFGPGATAGFVERAFQSDKDLIPSSDGGVGLGYEGTTNRRWKYLLAKDYAKADEIYGVNGLSERARAVRIGEWTQVAFAAGNFTGSGTLTWTLQAGDQTVLAYRVTGKTLRVSWYLVATSTGGAASFALKIAIPGGFVAARRTMGFHHYSDNGAGVAQGIAFVDAAATTIDLYHGDFGATNWSNAAANTTGTQGAIEFEIQ